MLHPTYDHHGHVHSEGDLTFLRIAIEGLNDSPAIRAMEEEQGLGAARETRQNMMAMLHIASVREWQEASDPKKGEVGVCEHCGGKVYREPEPEQPEAA